MPDEESILLNDRLREIERELCFSSENSLLSYELLNERMKIRDILADQKTIVNERHDISRTHNGEYGYKVLP